MLARGFLGLVLSGTIFVSTVVAEPGTAPSTPVASATPAPSGDEGKGLYLAPTIGVDVSAYSNTNVQGGIGFGGQFLAQYFFTPVVGIYLGVAPAFRKMTLNSSENVPFLDIPLGVGFQYSFNPTVKNFIGLGVVYMAPLGAFNDSGGAVNLQGTVGLDLQLNTYFPVSEGFEMGIGSDIRFSFASPFSTLSGPMMLSVQLGLTSRIRL